MRSLFFTVFLFMSLVSFGQSQTSGQAPAKAADKELDDKSLSADSLAIDEIQIEGSKKLKVVSSKSKSDSRKNAYGYEMEPAAEEAPAVIQSEQYQNASISFESSRKQASYQRSQRSPSYNQQVEMDNAVDYFQQNSPNSFEYHYFSYTAGNYDVSLFEHLAEAERLRPNNSDVHVQLAAYYIIKEEKQQALNYFDQLIASNRLTNDVLKYAEDILVSTPKNGTLITHGFDDSYGVWYLQAAKNIRTDVTLISMDFLQSKEYRNRLSSKGYVLPSSTSIDVNYFKEFCTLNAGKKLAVSMTTPKEYFKPVLNQMYTTGLVFEYHTAEFNNFNRNVELWGKLLKKYLIENATDEKAKQLSANYLPMLLQMRKVYHQQGDMKKVQELDGVIDKIGVQCKKYDRIQDLKKAY